MNPENSPYAVYNNPFFEFETLLNNACMRLQCKHAQYSIRRLKEMDAILANLETELNKLLKTN